MWEKRNEPEGKVLFRGKKNTFLREEVPIVFLDKIFSEMLSHTNVEVPGKNKGIPPPSKSFLSNKKCIGIQTTKIASFSSFRINIL